MGIQNTSNEIEENVYRKISDCGRFKYTKGERTARGYADLEREWFIRQIVDLQSQINKLTKTGDCHD